MRSVPGFNDPGRQLSNANNHLDDDVFILAAMGLKPIVSLNPGDPETRIRSLLIGSHEFNIDAIGC